MRDRGRSRAKCASASRGSDWFRAPGAAEKGPGRLRALTNAAVNTSRCPGGLFQQAGKGRHFEWQATPCRTPRI